MRCQTGCSSMFALITTLGLLGAAGCGPRVEPADLVLTNGHVATVDSSRPTAEGVAVRGDRIVAVGSIADMKGYIGQKTEVIDLNGRFAMPAFTEAHAHFTEVGESKLELQLAKAHNWDEIVAMVADAAKRAKPGDWILGRGARPESTRRPTAPRPPSPCQPALRSMPARSTAADSR